MSNTQTVLAAIVAKPGTIDELAERLDLPKAKVQSAVSYLNNTGKLDSEKTDGKGHPKRYSAHAGATPPPQGHRSQRQEVRREEVEQACLQNAGEEIRAREAGRVRMRPDVRSLAHHRRPRAAAGPQIQPRADRQARGSLPGAF